MNKQIRRLGVFLILCYCALFVKLNQVQVFEADDLNASPLNNRVVQREFNRPRGVITTADGALLAVSIDCTAAASATDPACESTQFKRIRKYPEGQLFAHTTGYFSFVFGESGVEKVYSEELSGNTVQQQVGGLLSNNETVGNVELSLRKDVQTVARDQLKDRNGLDREGSVVAIDPRTGEILALWSNPSYDPNLLSSPDIAATRDAWTALNADTAKPMQPKMYSERYFPGSTFKVVTSGVGLQTGKVTPDDPVYPAASSYLPPQTRTPIGNFGGEVCGGALFEILKFSCNSAYAEMGQKTIGAKDMLEGSQSFGFNATPPLDLTNVSPSVFPKDVDKNPPKLAQASIGQSDVQATPLEMALVAAGVANKGVILKPHVLKQVTDSEGKVIKTAPTEKWLEPMTESNAATLRQAMIGVVSSGTGTPAQVPGYEVAGKTGTAQLGDGARTHVWMIAFAGPPGGEPTVAVAVVVLNQNAARSDATGGTVAGPIASKVMQAVLAEQARGGAPTTTK